MGLNILHPRINKAISNFLYERAPHLVSDTAKTRIIGEKVTAKMNGMRLSAHEHMIGELETGLADPTSKIYKNMQEAVEDSFDPHELADKMFSHIDSVTENGVEHASKKGGLVKGAALVGGAVATAAVASNIIGNSDKNAQSFNGTSAEQAGAMAALKDAQGMMPPTMMAANDISYEGRVDGMQRGASI